MNQIPTFGQILLFSGCFRQNLKPNYRFIWIIYNKSLPLRYEQRAKRAEYEDKKDNQGADG